MVFSSMSIVLCCLVWIFAQAPVSAVLSTKPNILFILTDDQDHHMQSLQHMPFLQKYLVNEGTVFDKHFCTVAICCPSRVNLWTGRLAHNTNVTDIFPPYGGYPKIVREGINSNYLPIWMQEAGYNTYYAGKLWNAHSVDNYNKPTAEGFNGSDFLLDPYTYQYYNSWMSRNGDQPVNYQGQYSPDVVAEKAYAFLDEATKEQRPWMLTVAPIAPHSDCVLGEKNFRIDHPAYAPRHAHLFRDYKIPRTPDFNPTSFHGVSWMKDLPLLNDTVIEYNDEFQRSRLRSLQSVDEMIGKLINMLDNKGLLDNTYVFFTTDNGYHISQHRLHPGKECGFDTDIHIPLIVRGPGIPRGQVSEQVTSHTDISPTILGLAGRSREDFDGAPLMFHPADAQKNTHEHVNIEFWGNVIPEGLWGKYGDGFDPHTGSHLQGLNNTYKAVRIVSPDYSLYYSVWCTGEKEYYDMKLDPYQVKNFYAHPASLDGYRMANRPFEEVVSRLDALVMVLKSCKMEDCRRPWKVLHPQGNVRTLVDALSKQFDDFYNQQPKVAFTSCELGYIKEAEGPQDAHRFGGDSGEIVLAGPSPQTTFQYRGRWSEWT